MFISLLMKANEKQSEETECANNKGILWSALLFDLAQHLDEMSCRWKDINRLLFALANLIRKKQNHCRQCQYNEKISLTFVLQRGK